METMYTCTCGEKFHNQDVLDQHKKNCKDRLYSCILCDEKVASKDMNYHLYLCGNKTNKCPICEQYIRRAIYNYHLENDCIDPDDDNPYEDDFSLLDRRNDSQLEDNNFVPCEFCHEQIKFSNYNFHSRNCSQNSNYHRLNLPELTIDYSTHQQETHPRSTINESINLNDAGGSIQQQSDMLNTSFEGLDLDPDRNLLNSSPTNKSISKEGAISLLHEKAVHVQDALSKDYFSTEINHVTEKLQFNIVLAGSPRVGKSQLINALCNINLAETSPSLNSCTKQIRCYTLEDNQQRTPGIQPFKINFYDTPGIEAWTDQGGQKIMFKLIEEKDPVCFIYCAAPGSFADLKQLTPVLELCKKKEIFCALVCTNMWANQHRKEVIEEFKKELTSFGEQIQRSFDQGYGHLTHTVTLFGKRALCTMVNSMEYYDPDISPERKPVQGIDELIYCIMEGLDQDKLLGWCNTVLYRRTFWEKISQKANGFYSTNLPSINNLLDKNKDNIALQFVVHLFNKIRQRRV